MKGYLTYKRLTEQAVLLIEKLLNDAVEYPVLANQCWKQACSLHELWMNAGIEWQKPEDDARINALLDKIFGMQQSHVTAR